MKTPVDISPERVATVASQLINGHDADPQEVADMLLTLCNAATASERQLAEAVYQEREACRAIANMVGDKKDGGHSLGYRSAAWEIAELIQGRGTNNA